MTTGPRSLRFLFVWALGLAALLATPLRGRADIGVTIADPTSIGVSWFTHAGHSLVYLSSVCAASPVRARLCHPGEQGSIVTMYPDFYERRRYAWNIVPLNLYLEGVEEPGNRLLYASANVKAALELRARIGFLSSACGNSACAQREHAYWRDLVGATIDRDLFVYAVHTSRAQDEEVVRWLNDQSNVNRYNSLTNNCSNFVASMINTVFPHSVHRDLLNDLGMMSPKGAARSFTLWAAKRPQLGLYTLHFAQQPGSLPRSGLARSGTEDGFHMKKYMIPAALIGDHEVAGSFLVVYYLTGRFGLYKQYVRHAAPSPVVLEEEPETEGLEVHAASFSRERGETSEATVGSPAEWWAYKKAFAGILKSSGMQARPKGQAVLFPKSFAHGEAWVDATAQPFLTVGEGAAARTVGVSSEDLLSRQSDPDLAFRLMLARVAYALSAKNHSRESMLAFRQDWALLLAARDRWRGAQSKPQGSSSAFMSVAAQR